MAKPNKRNDKQGMNAIHEFIPEQIDVVRLMPSLRENFRHCPPINKVRPER